MFDQINSKKIVQILKDIYEEFLPMMEWRISSHATDDNWSFWNTLLWFLPSCDHKKKLGHSRLWVICNADHQENDIHTVSSTEVEDLNEVKEFRPV